MAPVPNDKTNGEVSNSEVFPWQCIFLTEMWDKNVISNILSQYLEKEKYEAVLMSE